MTKTWRPEGWERPFRYVITPSLAELVEAQHSDATMFYQNEFFELGADRMLKALLGELSRRSIPEIVGFITAIRIDTEMANLLEIK